MANYQTGSFPGFEAIQNNIKSGKAEIITAYPVTDPKSGNLIYSDTPGEYVNQDDPFGAAALSASTPTPVLKIGDKIYPPDSNWRITPVTKQVQTGTEIGEYGDTYPVYKEVPTGTYRLGAREDADKAIFNEMQIGTGDQGKITGFNPNIYQTGPRDEGMFGGGFLGNLLSGVYGIAKETSPVWMAALGANALSGALAGAGGVAEGAGALGAASDLGGAAALGDFGTGITGLSEGAAAFPVSTGAVEVAGLPALEATGAGGITDLAAFDPSTLATAGQGAGDIAAGQLAGGAGAGGIADLSGLDIGDTIPFTPEQVEGLYPVNDTFTPFEGIDMGETIPYTPEQVEGLYPEGGVFAPTAVPPEHPFLQGMEAENAVSGPGVAGAGVPTGTYTGGANFLSGMEETAATEGAGVAGTGIATGAGAGAASGSLLQKLSDATGLSPTTLAGIGAGLAGSMLTGGQQQPTGGGGPAQGTVGAGLSPSYQAYTYKPYAQGGIASLSQMAAGGISNLGGYSDGGRLLRGPGDGVSDDIPASIGGKQPARLADGEFVVPARIVSEIGNGSTDAGAKKLYAMMDRVQSARRKTMGKKQFAKDTKAEKYMPV